MPVTDLMRTQIRGCLNGLRGEEMSDIMMELLPPAGWGDVVRRQDVSSMHVELRMELISTHHSLSRQIADLRMEMRLGFAAIDTQFQLIQKDFEMLQESMKRLHTTMLATIGTVVAVGGTIISMLFQMR